MITLKLLILSVVTRSLALATRFFTAHAHVGFPSRLRNFARGPLLGRPLLLFQDIG